MGLKQALRATSSQEGVKSIMFRLNSPNVDSPGWGGEPLVLCLGDSIVIHRVRIAVKLRDRHKAFTPANGSRKKVLLFRLLTGRGGVMSGD